MQYDPKIKHNIGKSSRVQQEVDKEVEELKAELNKVQEEIAEKKKAISELRMKKRSIKTLFKRNEQR